MATPTPSPLQRVLVTGGSGFIAGHCILELLRRGYAVRTTVRSLDRESAVRSVLSDAGMVDGDALTFVAADLTADHGWADAVRDCANVLHVASPVRPGAVEHDDDLIVPARDGALRVLRAAREAGVERVVLTSAFHAVSWGHPRRADAFTEDDWTVVDGPGVDAYGKSKTLAERAGWDFVTTDGGPMQLTTMLPVAVMGPALGTDVSGANQLIQRLLAGTMPGVPDLWLPVVDVRDVALAHVLAMITPAAAGERFLLSNGPAVSLRQIAALLRDRLGDDASRVPRRAIPSVVVRLAAVFSAEFRSVVPDLGYAKQTSNAKAERVLGWRPRSAEEAILASARSLVEKGLVDGRS